MSDCKSIPRLKRAHEVKKVARKWHGKCDTDTENKLTEEELLF